jgi:hypothetical protein
MRPVVAIKIITSEHKYAMSLCGLSAASLLMIMRRAPTLRCPPAGWASQARRGPTF